MSRSPAIDYAALNRRVQFTRALAGILINHSFPDCSKLLRNAYKLFGTPPAGPLRIRTHHGFDMVVNPLHNKGADSLIYYNGTYEAGTLHVIMSSLRKGDVFIDAGANIGLMSLAAATKVGPEGKVHAFEPVPDVFAQLQQNAAINPADNIQLHNSALGSRLETRAIYDQEHINKGSASLVQPDSGTSARYMVDVETLDSFSGSINNRHIRMIKADVEGWQLDVLQGGKKLLSTNNAPILCVEYSVSYSPRKEQLHDVYDFIRNINDYQIFKLRNGKETISPLIRIAGIADLPKHGNIFCFMPHHIAEIGKNIFG